MDENRSGSRLAEAAAALTPRPASPKSHVAPRGACGSAVVLAILLLGGLLSGGREALAQTPADSAPQSVRYRVEATPPEIFRLYSADQISILEKLNRADADHLPGLPALVLPDRWDADELDYSPLPRAISAFAAHGKALIIHQPGQVFAAYERGRLVRWGPVSTGSRANPTPEGRFNLNWKSRGRFSTVDPDWYMEWYFNFDDRRGLALHQFELPGHPASHGCVRLLERDARWLFGWGDVSWYDVVTGTLHPGTPLTIVGGYDYSAEPPWRNPEAPHPTIVVDP